MIDSTQKPLNPKIMHCLPMLHRLFFASLIFIGMLFNTSNIQAQEVPTAPDLGAGRVFFGFESGINSKVGLLGVRLQAAATNKIAFGAGAGLGSWGGKLGFYGRYYFKENFRGSYLHFGYNIATGLSGFETELETDDLSASGVEDRTVTLDFKPVGLIDLGYGYAGKLGQKSRFYFQTGLAFRTVEVTDTYELKTPGLVLTETSEDILQLLSPGGLILAIGIDFGL